MKFTVGQPVGGPATYSDPAATEDPAARQILGLEGVESVFMTADFITVTKSSGADWETLSPAVMDVLSSIYD